VSSLAPAIGLVVIAAITPGPNNFVVLRAAARAGMRAALPAIVGAVAGGLVLLAVVAAGAGRVFAAEASLRTVAALGGGAYLAWLGLRMVLGSAAPSDDAEGAEPASPAPSRAAAMFAFQFLNPKAWVMVLAVTAATPDALVPLAAVFTVVPFACLSLWSALGAFGLRRLRGAAMARLLDRAFGVALVVVAVALAFES